jgi:hypothetical protein
MPGVGADDRDALMFRRRTQIELLSWLLVSLAALSLAACSSGGGGDPVTQGAGSNLGACPSGSLGGSAACEGCVMAKCGAELDVCFHDGAACASWATAGCQGTVNLSCAGCVTASVQACVKANCTSACTGSTTSGGGTTSEPPPRPSPTTAECRALLECCDADTFAAQGIWSCYHTVGADDADRCRIQHNEWRANGACPR